MLPSSPTSESESEKVPCREWSVVIEKVNIYFLTSGWR